MKTKDIIKVLPFDKEFQIELLNQYDGLPLDRKSSVAELLWETYDALYELKLDENLQLALLRAKDNQEKLDNNFYKRVVEKTDKEMESEVTETIAKLDLASTRQELKKIIKKPSI